MRNFLTVDVEEYFQVEGFADVVDRSSWDGWESRVRGQTLRILDLLDAARQKGTFFVLGWCARKDPDLVAEIARRGHEVACHGFSHRMADQLGEAAFRDDTQRAKELLETILGSPVLGYRAPSFSFTDRTPWAHGVLADLGFAYSSSVFPVRHDRYGVPDAPRTTWIVRTSGGREIAEIPPLTMRVAGQNLPVAGGGYMRLLPVQVVGRGIDAMNAAGHPAMLYMHPWEIDPGQPRIHGRPMNRFRHYVGLAGMESKLRWLLDRYAFTTVASHLGLEAPKSVRPLRPVA